MMPCACHKEQMQELIFCLNCDLSTKQFISSFSIYLLVIKLLQSESMSLLQSWK